MPANITDKSLIDFETTFDDIRYVCVPKHFQSKYDNTEIIYFDHLMWFGIDETGINIQENQDDRQITKEYITDLRKCNTIEQLYRFADLWWKICPDMYMAVHNTISPATFNRFLMYRDDLKIQETITSTNVVDNIACPKDFASIVCPWNLLRLHMLSEQFQIPEIPMLFQSIRAEILEPYRAGFWWYK